eukprot:TRINITY_DN47393_c0_g1_i1.p1 TRINITY_DN47393_c0_g1~~TRINITY_DN47393_c0_g1_i1.p1  ORF type:complete len:975 (-),score=242.31 TRINITY_DN47393_c0_g1_i1:38-2962(-)
MKGGRLHDVLDIDDTSAFGAPSRSPGTEAQASAAASMARSVERLCLQAERQGRRGWEQVLPELVAHAESFPRDAQAWAYLARARLAVADKRQALRAAEEALRIDPAIPLGHSLLVLVAQEASKLRKWDDVAKHAEAALGSQPGDAEALELLMRALVARGHGGTEKSKATLRVLEQVDPRRGVVLLREFGTSSKSPAERHHWLTQALACARAAAKAGEDSSTRSIKAQLLRDLGEVCLVLEKGREALGCFEEAFTHPEGSADPEIGRSLAQLYVRNGRAEDALEVYRVALQASPGSLSLIRGYGQLLLKEGRTTEAIGAISRGAKLASSSEASALHLLLAELHQNLGHSAEALIAWEAAASLNPDSLAAWRGLAAAAAAARDGNLQLRALRRLVLLEPSNAEWHAQLGAQRLAAAEGFAMQSAWAEAEADLDRALRLDSTHPLALAKKAFIYANTGKDALALELAEQAARTNPTSKIALEAAASIRWQRGDVQEAEKWYEDLRRVDPEHGRAAQVRGGGGERRDRSETVCASRPETSPKAASSREPEASKELHPGQAVEVYSKSGGQWLSGEIMQANSDMVKVRYFVESKTPGTESQWCEKVLLKSSESLRLKQTPPVRSAVESSSGSFAPAPRETGSKADATLLPDNAPANPAARTEGNSSKVDVTPNSKKSIEYNAPATPAARTEGNSSASKPAKKELVEEPKSFLLRAQDLNIGKVLGSGGFGAVYRGTYLGQEVAIKKLHPMDGQVTPEQLEEFKKEVANLQALKHVRLVSFIGCAFASPSLMIVTEFMPNGSLYDALHQRKLRLELAKRFTIGVQITEGVAFLHSKKPPFVHRDLKSMNVVMDNDMSVKLCDFGLTQSMEKTHISRRDNEGGSPRYMAPELFDSKGKITEKVDVWALGCLLVEVCTSRLPHEECTSIQQVMTKTLVDKQLPFTDWKDVSAGIRVLAEACFNFQPDARTTARALLEGLMKL